MSEENQHNNWMSFSDLMTGLMVIFMFIAISYMLEAKKEQSQQNIIFEEFKATQEALYADLKNEFKDDFKDWEVQLDKDLSIKFTNPDILFKSNKHFKNCTLPKNRPRFPRTSYEFVKN